MNNPVESCNKPRKTSGLAIASFICGILSLTIVLMPVALPSIICGRVARARIKKSEGTIGGGRLALAGLLMGYGSFVVFAFILFVLPPDSGPPFRDIDGKALTIGHQIGRACRIYAKEHHGAFPVTLGELVPDYCSGAEAFICPFTPKEPIGYIYYPGQHDTDSTENVLLVSKGVSRSGKRIVIRVDGSGTITRFVLPEPGR